MDEKIAKAGSLLCVDHGEYSDYSVIGFFVVLKDFCPFNQLTEYLNDNIEQKYRYNFREYQFLSFLISKGLLLEIEYGNLYMGKYSDCSDVSFKSAIDISL